MLRVKEAIVVEGRYDKNTLSQLVDTVIVETAGFGIFKDGERLALLRRLAETPQVKQVTLLPLMVVAGDHAKNDLAGQEEDSWRSMLEKRGYAVRCVLEGLGENPAIRAIFVRHAREAAGA